MRRFLVVGCGGSGGQTLAYMMDQLRSELAAHGVHDLPAGWQFVHVDVPTGAEPGPDGIGNVAAQGGRYAGLGQQGVAYGVLDNAVTHSLAGGDSLGQIGTWAPREPGRVYIPISTGAGQYRAIGRMITLSKAAELKVRLEAVWDILAAVDTASELRELAVRMPDLGDYNPDDDPIVIVVSSMAGGAGASMALDVCRLLTLIPNLNPALMGVFMFSADVFDSLPSSATTGVRANALAMLGEIVASQAESARPHDVATLAALGQQNGDGRPIPFARVFPVGRMMGVKRTPFGDGSMRAVYRGLGRGLAGLMASGVATDKFVSYDLGNTGSPDGDRDVLGWGAQWDPLAWGAFGFASLSMGRDRYAEYSSQRLARSAVERLLRGHLQVGNNAVGNEQRDALLSSQWSVTAQQIGLPAVGVPADRASQALVDWLTAQAFPRQMVYSEAEAIVDRELRDHLPSPDGTQSAHWLPALRERAASRRANVIQAARDAAYRWTYDWHQQFLVRLHRSVEQAVASFGLPYAQELLARIKSHLEFLLSPIGELAQNAPRDPTTVPVGVEQLATAARGPIRDGQALMERLRAGLAGQVQDTAYGHSAVLVSQVLAAICSDILPTLQATVSESQRVLETAERATITDAGLARVATDQVPAWPADTDQRVNPRFDNATNEILLTSSKEFQQRYDEHIQTAASGSAPSGGVVNAIGNAVFQVISGIWHTTSSQPAPGGLLVQTTPWRSRVFVTEPGTGKPLTPQAPRYDLHVRPSELVGRSRIYIARPNMSFATFCNEGLREFVEGTGASESSRPQRVTEIVSKFREALTLALPLIGVNGDAVRAVHNTAVQYRYKFSAVPFAQLGVADDLARVLVSDAMVDGATQTNFAAALSTTGSTKIDIFGSYQNYSPIVFDSVLKPVAEQWAATTAQGRESFWRWRRSRPLTAALPMSEVERRAMVAGWFVGQMVGQIKIPDPPFKTAVLIWDSETTSWASFPHPLLTPPEQFKAPYDWLPAILESSLLAIAKSYQNPVMSSMKPYQLLRRLYDATPSDPAGAIFQPAAAGSVTQWLATGRSGTGAPSRIADAATATSIDDRALAATGWLTQIRELAADFVPQEVSGSVTPGGSSSIRTRLHAAQTPIFRDVAEDVFWATGELMELVAQGAVAAKQGPSKPLSSGAPIEVDTAEVVIPKGWNF